MAYIDRMSLFGTFVRSTRESLGWTRSYLAAETRIGERTLARWEAGQEDNPKVQHLRTFLAVTGTPPDDLLRALGLLPDVAEPQPGLNTDEQAVWELGQRRGWSPEDRMALIDLWRGRQLRPVITDADAREVLDRITDGGQGRAEPG